jgi:hypothetical protein
MIAVDHATLRRQPHPDMRGALHAGHQHQRAVTRVDQMPVERGSKLGLDITSEKGDRRGRIF